MIKCNINTMSCSFENYVSNEDYIKFKEKMIVFHDAGIKEVELYMENIAFNSRLLSAILTFNSKLNMKFHVHCDEYLAELLGHIEMFESISINKKDIHA